MCSAVQYAARSRIVRATPLHIMTQRHAEWNRELTALKMYSHDADGDNDTDDGTQCLDFSIRTAQTVLSIKLSIGAFTVLANLLAIVLIIASKRYRDFLYRLVVYLLITDILQAFAICLALFPIIVPDDTRPARVRNGTLWHDSCAGTGFVLMTTMWMGNIVIIWIVGHLVILGCREQRSHYSEKVKNTDNTPCNRNEVLGVLFLFFGPFLVSWIPFILPGEMYGISGLWCWIKMVQTSCVDIKKETLTVVFIFFYGPLVLIVLFSLICMILTIVLVCHGAVRRHFSVDHHQRRMKEIIIALAYPMLYCTVCLILLANRIYSVSHSDEDPNLGLWYAHTVADPVRVLLPAVAFLLHPFVWRDICSGRKKTTPSSIAAGAGAATHRQNQPDQSSHMHANEEDQDDMEDDLLITQSNVNNTYGTYDDDERYLSGVVDS